MCSGISEGCAPRPTHSKLPERIAAVGNQGELHCPLSIVNCPLSLTVDDDLGEIGDAEVAVGMLTEFVGEFNDFLG